MVVTIFHLILDILILTNLVTKKNSKLPFLVVKNGHGDISLDYGHVYHNQLNCVELRRLCVSNRALLKKESDPSPLVPSIDPAKSGASNRLNFSGQAHHYPRHERIPLINHDKVIG
ncbi:unnamed protein product [Lupinus luteus]|uniref:Uncharacterized protein n=1 Tax=Lupinus luteus TaxID=3873 RepID=A0AAV1YFR3_LUPLU